MSFPDQPWLIADLYGHHVMDSKDSIIDRMARCCFYFAEPSLSLVSPLLVVEIKFPIIFDTPFPLGRLE